MSNEIELPSDRAALARVDFVGQATAVEQARAVAEVQAAVLVAQQVPRVIARAVAEMRESCAMVELANRAFYSYSRGGSTVAGASVHLARELARTWGNVQYGIGELRRDDDAHYSEMQAFAWDVQTNTRSSQTFIVPHKRDKKGGPTVLVDLRDVYENNANMGARRLREAIFAILPPWFTAEAEAICGRTLKDGGGQPLPIRIANAVKAFAELGVTVPMLEAQRGRPQNDWTPVDLGQLSVLRSSLSQGTITIAEAFDTPVTAGEILATARPAATPSSEPTKPEPNRELADDGLPANPEFDLDPDDDAWVNDAKGAKP